MKLNKFEREVIAFLRNRAPLAREHFNMRNAKGCPRCYARSLSGEEGEYYNYGQLQCWYDGLSCTACGFRWGDIYVMLSIEEHDSNPELTASELIKIEALRQENSQSQEEPSCTNSSTFSPQLS